MPWVVVVCQCPVSARDGRDWCGGAQTVGGQATGCDIPEGCDGDTAGGRVDRVVSRRV